MEKLSHTFTCLIGNIFFYFSVLEENSSFDVLMCRKSNPNLLILKSQDKLISHIA